MAAKKSIDNYLPTAEEMSVINVEVPAALKERSEKNMSKRAKKIKWKELMIALLERFNE